MGRVVGLTLLVLVLGSCGGDDTAGDAGGDIITVGGDPVVLADGGLELTIQTVRDRGDSVSTAQGTLSVDAAKRDTHTIFEVPFTASVVSGEQLGIAFDSLVLTAEETDAEIALMCSGSFCGTSTSSFGVFAGSNADMTLYVVAASTVESFLVEFTGPVAWPPTDAGAPEAPEQVAPAETVVEVNP